MAYRSNSERAACVWNLVRAGISQEDAIALRRISMTLQRWHELEYGDSNNHGSWAIERDGDEPDSKPFMVYHIHHGNFGWSVWCREDDKADGSRGDMVRATRKTFPTKERALSYLQSIPLSREPELRQIFTRRTTIPDREKGAQKRLGAILARYPGFTAYVQGDPRGCALYVLRPGDVKDGEDVSSVYNRGIAVYR